MKGLSLSQIVFAIVALPLVGLLFSIDFKQTEVLEHVYSVILPQAILNTLKLAAAVTAFTFALGVGLAYVVSRYDFFARSVLESLIPLTLAIPGYVLAFIYIDLFDYSGVVQSYLRDMGFQLGVSVRNFYGLTLVLTMAMTPYVYLLSRLGFQKQGSRLYQVGQSLGIKGWKSFIKISIPANAPWILGGLLLVNMEVLSDFGTVSAFNYRTLTVSIYRAWFGLMSFEIASQLSFILFALVLAVLIIKSKTGRRKRYESLATINVTTERKPLRGIANVLAFGLLSTFVFFALALPLFKLGFWVLKAPSHLLEFGQEAKNTFVIATVAGLLVVPVAVLLTFSGRHKKSQTFGDMALFGYALPGTVLAVSLMISFHLMGISISSAPVFVVLLAMGYGYLIRFLNVAVQPLRSGLKKVKPELEHSAKLLGATQWSYLKSIYYPLLKPSLIGAITFVFIEVVKEMPLTLMMRPYGWDTFSVKVYEFTSEGEWEKAAVPAFFIVLFSLIPSFLFQKSLNKEAV